MERRKTALLSASRKDEHLYVFARNLASWGWKLLASAGTKKFLDQHAVPSADIGDIVGPPILGHRVVTLDRKIYAALLARPIPEHLAELERIGIDMIDLVYVDLYPLADELATQGAKPGSWIEAHYSVVEKIDIGGPTLLRAAAKGGRWVVSSTDQIPQVSRFLNPAYAGDATRDKAEHYFQAQLAAEAEMVVSKYAALAAEFYDSVACGEFPRRFVA